MWTILNKYAIPKLCLPVLEEKVLSDHNYGRTDVKGYIEKGEKADAGSTEASTQNLAYMEKPFLPRQRELLQKQVYFLDENRKCNKKWMKLGRDFCYISAQVMVEKYRGAATKAKSIAEDCLHNHCSIRRKALAVKHPTTARNSFYCLSVVFYCNQRSTRSDASSAPPLQATSTIGLSAIVASRSGQLPNLDNGRGVTSGRIHWPEHVRKAVKGESVVDSPECRL
ncbi:hypothetical protein Trydic_g2732 [Trypoxylus dichotomus]